MNEFYNNLSQLETAYWSVALIGSFIFILIFITTFIGGDMDSDVEIDAAEFEADDGGVGFQFFTFKNTVAFFTIFGWTGIICAENGLSTLLTLVIATIAGLAMMVATSMLFYWMSTLAENGILKINNAINVVGEVYLPIGANRSKIGKISIKVQGALRELEALTDSEEELATGTVIKVLEVVSSEILLVKKL
ncbi:MAG: hypothetical protein COB60_04995 [Flavobacteriaceae bacterium]|nr:MAG: hypothetical protein COB60_04995 [Flavobacteriaceae bacterium]